MKLYKLKWIPKKVIILVLKGDWAIDLDRKNAYFHNKEINKNIENISVSVTKGQFTSSWVIGCSQNFHKIDNSCSSIFAK